MAQTPHTPPATPDKPADKPTPESRPAESRFSTPAADPAESPSQRRAQADAPKLRACVTRLEDFQHRVAHTLGADDLAALAAVIADLDAMAPAPTPAADPPAAP